jgi:hypothetical protein
MARSDSASDFMEWKASGFNHRLGPFLWKSQNRGWWDFEAAVGEIVQYWPMSQMGQNRK